MAEYGPYTSKDLDYFGYRAAAQKLADAIGGTVRIPHGDDHTPQTAVVTAMLAGRNIEIDFLSTVKGVSPLSLERQAVELLLTVRAGARAGELRVPIMHPLHCLQSRLANVVDLGRRTDLARRQLEASTIVLRAYLCEMVDDGRHRHVTGVLKSLHDYLLTDLTGCKAHMEMRNDPASILDTFQGDERLDERWRRLTLLPMRKRIVERRSAWGKMKARIRVALGR